ncbi:MAG: phosphoribosylglycinamide formyltransferase, partial [Candidatus Omnitrophica bacterium]|nr:phosphoribosylglycinamide formyltransferase [Candidatus Omnitrophota bacterium]
MFTVALLASGKGSNVKAIIENVKGGEIPVDIGVILSDNPSSGALEIAKKEGIKHYCIQEKRYKTILSNETEKEYVKVLQECKTDLVCLAGFMRVIKEEFLKNFYGKIINIHP